MMDTTNKIRVAIAGVVLSAAGLIHLTGNEGYTDTVVIPVKGDRPTIGFGSTEGVKLGDRTTPVLALARAYREIGNTERAVKGCVTAPVSQVEYDIYIDMAYNIGVTAFCKSTMVRKLNALDYVGACAEFDRFVFVAGHDCRIRANKCYGIVERRAKSRAICEGESLIQ